MKLCTLCYWAKKLNATSCHCDGNEWLGKCLCECAKRRNEVRATIAMVDQIVEGSKLADKRARLAKTS